jgi:Mlc titration factor MtfA (ptsG expression regulator)
MGWWSDWRVRWRARRESRLLRSRPIPDDLWLACLSRHPFLAQRTPEDLATLRRLATLFLARKEFTGAGGLEPTDDMAVSIAAQACLPILHLGLDAYDGFIGIVVHPDEVVARREVVDEDGVVHHYDETLSGEAMEGGPVMLSWRDVDAAAEPSDRSYNVVIHEFVHVLDMRDGLADGIPPLPSRAARTDWEAVMGAEFQAFRDALDADPLHDPVIDPYGAEAPEEFFAVASEAFFVTPVELRREYPRLYRLLAGYFDQDPAAAQPSDRRRT